MGKWTIVVPSPVRPTEVRNLATAERYAAPRRVRSPLARAVSGVAATRERKHVTPRGVATARVDAAPRIRRAASGRCLRTQCVRRRQSSPLVATDTDGDDGVRGDDSVLADARLALRREVDTETGFIVTPAQRVDPTGIDLRRKVPLALAK